MEIRGPKQKKFLQGLIDGLPPSTAAKQAGYANRGSVHQMMQNPALQAYVQKEKRKIAAELSMTRQKVLDGFLEAISMARITSDPHAMIKGWTEIGKMCGFYAPEVKKLDISISAKRVIGHLETLSDAELLQIAEKDITESAEIIDFGDAGPSAAETGAETEEGEEETAEGALQDDAGEQESGPAPTEVL